ncbi:YqjF family protein [Ureibacillus sp. GCM10028918]|uniref:YqjF family protein n=1 Tax=Ureibacillus sp. GCM10028918 TaxID=3273429 RepID=UPI0036182768
MKEQTFVKEGSLTEKRKLTTNLPWMMKQTWNDVLFAHYPVSRKVLEKLVPSELTLDTFYQTGWVSVVPYLTSSMHLRGLPPVPGMAAFPGFNVRTYVTLNGKPGVYFFSLTAANFLAAFSARTFFRLPYSYMDMQHKKAKELIIFESEKKSGIQLLCNYKSISTPSKADKGSLEEWLVERYCLYTVSKKGVPFRVDIMHEPWLLEKADAEFHRNTLLSSFNIVPDHKKPILHYAKKAVVRIWPIVPANE